MAAERVRNPLIPGNTKDRTGTGGILRRAVAVIRVRYAALQQEVLRIFDRIPVYQVNDVAVTRTMYGLTPDEMAATSQALGEALDRWIVSGRETAYGFWYSAYDEEATRLGSVQTLTNLTRLSDGYAAARSLQQIVFSQPYRDRVAMAQIKSYEHWTGLAAGARSELSQIIGRAVVDGKSPTAARAEIMAALDVSKSRAMGYAQTDITETLREARRAEADWATENMGINLGLLWTSALIPTTRPWHASRNGKVYTTAEVKEFYSKNGNRFRCHCATTECLLDTDGNPILTDGLKAKMKTERAGWEKAHGKASS